MTFDTFTYQTAWRKFYCRICGEWIFTGEPCYVVIHKSHGIAIHLKHLSKELLDEVMVKEI